MPVIAPVSITALPTPPSTAFPATFDTQADAFLGAFPGLRTDINREAATINNNATEAGTQASNASNSAAAALSSQNAAAASAVSANAGVGAAKWLVSTSYAEGAVAWSPITYQTYRKKTAGSVAGGADPSANDAVWAQIGSSPYAFVNLDILF